MNETYYGIYCPQHYGSWHRRVDGEIYFYPSKEIAEAHLETTKSDNAYLHGPEQHLYEACEFGKQKYFDPHKAQAGTPICPVRMPHHFTEGY